MIALGAACAAVAVAALIACARRDGRIARRLARVAPPRALDRWRPVGARELGQSGIGWTQTQLVAAKVVAACVGASGGAAIGVALGIGAIPIVPGAYAGFIGPSVLVERTARRRRDDAEDATGAVIERLEALVAAGRPLETALVAVTRRPSGAVPLDAALRRAADRYALGAPIFGALVAAASEEGLQRLGALAADLERARDLGRGSLAVLRDARDAARARERSRCIEAAAQVEGKLMLVLVLCYLPALLLLVVIPLFLGLLDSLFG